MWFFSRIWICALGLVLAALVCVQTGQATGQAQDSFTLNVRVADHPEYSRLVFDWNDVVGYRVEQKGSVLQVAFDTPAAARLPGLKTIDGIKSLSLADTRLPGAALQVDVGVPAGATYRDFRLGKKVVVDVLLTKEAAVPPVQPVPAQTAKKETPKPDPVKKVPPPAVKQDLTENKKPASVTAAAEEPIKLTLPDETESAPAPEKETVLQESPSVAAPEKQAPEHLKSFEEIAVEPVALVSAEKTMPAEKVDAVEEVRADSAEPALSDVQAVSAEDTVISVSTAQPVKAAIFARGSALWILLETDLSGVPPQITGSLRSFFGRPERLDFDGATAFRLPLPGDYNIFADKSELVWSVTLSKTRIPKQTTNLLKPVFNAKGKGVRVEGELEKDMKVYELQDPALGDSVHVIPVSSPKLRYDIPQKMVDFETVPVAAGIAIRPLSDGVEVSTEGSKVVVTRDPYLNTSPHAQSVPYRLVEEEAPLNRLFDLPNWFAGGPDRFFENKRRIEDELKEIPVGQRTVKLIELAQLHFANNMGHEVLGILRLALMENPSLQKNPDYLALRGAARALSGKNVSAYADLSIPALQDEPEAALWRGFAASGAEQWGAAWRSFPSSNQLVATYPGTIGVRVSLFMAEAALRHGDTERARAILRTIENAVAVLESQHLAALHYLKAEASRQEGDIDAALKQWEKVEKGRDRLYHAKAAFSIVLTRLQKGDITPKDAIEQLETLRFAWRGDSLEISILHQLGRLYLEQEDYRKGLNILRDAAALAEIEDDRRDIADEMTAAFKKLYVDNKAAELQPLEALAIYNEFSELTPPGPDGDKAIQQLVTNLIQVDLLSRAVRLLEQQIEHRLKNPLDISRVATRLAAIYLLDSKPQQALGALQKAAQAENLPPLLQQEQRLLKSRALSQLNRPDAALSELVDMENKNAAQLRVFINWQAKRWPDAAAALEILLKNYYTLTPPLDDEQAETLLNYVVAVRLAGQKEKLAALGEQYGKVMEKTRLGNAFHVVTRGPGRTTLADRETMKELVSEVDTFKGFLDVYRGNTTQPEPVPTN